MRGGRGRDEGEEKTQRGWRWEFFFDSPSLLYAAQNTEHRFQIDFPAVDLYHSVSRNPNSTMDFIAQIQGVQDIILRKLPPPHLLKMLTLSKEWVEPSLSHAHVALEQMSGEFITTLNDWEKRRTTTRRWLDRKRRDNDFEGVPVHSNKVVRLIDDFLSRNKRGNSARFKHLHQEYIDLCTTLSILRLVHDAEGGDYWKLQYSHKIYDYTEPLLRTRHKLECMREELVKLFRITLHSSQQHRFRTDPGPIGLFHCATRPDLMVLRLATLLSLLQKT